MYVSNQKELFRFVFKCKVSTLCNKKARQLGVSLCRLYFQNINTQKQNNIFTNILPDVNDILVFYYKIKLKKEKKKTTCNEAPMVFFCVLFFDKFSYLLASLQQIKDKMVHHDRAMLYIDTVELFYVQKHLPAGNKFLHILTIIIYIILQL